MLSSFTADSSLFVEPLAKVGIHHLQLESTLQALSLFDFQIELGQPGLEVHQAFAANPLLPGVILTARGQFAGMISRRRFLEYMSRPYGIELFSQRPIQALHDFSRTDILSLLGSTLIVMAAQRAVNRSHELLYEPIVVQIEPQVYRLLDVHQLLIAQSQIHEHATWLLSKLYYDLEVANQELQRLTILDDLTQVANRRRFDEYLDQECRRLHRIPAPLSLIMCDVDFFKKYNDTYGHQAGDECLRQVAQAIEQTVNRSSDLVSRYGGEEFAVILPSTNSSGAVFVAELILAEVRARAIAHAASPVSSYVTVSLGIATLTSDVVASPQSLIAEADQALYQAKASGRNRYCIAVS